LVGVAESCKVIRLRLALFGGTFDPIHNAHLTVAREAASQFSLERVLFVPAAHPPHKVDSLAATYEDRFAMVRLACAVDLHFEASRLEDGSGTSYSIDTVEKVRGLSDELFFIIGADAFAEITTWHRWRELLQLTQFIVVTRPGHDDYQCPDGARVHRLDTLALPVSSSDIRQQLIEGRIPNELPPAVAKYIQTRGLYQWSRAAGVNAVAD
jgi:nicotinate-nucleotide adenylyltransferase